MLYIKKLTGFLMSLSIISSTISGIVVHADEEYPWPNGPEVMAESAILIEARTGTILYEKNSHDVHYPASITKIMTALLTLENASLDETVTYSRDAIFSIEPGSNHIALNPGEELSVENSLYGLLLASANEVANGLGEHIAGTMDDFAIMMTERAKELGCLNTNFTNANGLHNDNHYSTSYDMALIAREAFNNETFVRFDSTPSYTIPPTNLQPESRVINMGHKMIRKSQKEYYEPCIGGKTGYTVKSKNTLVTCAEIDGLKLISVVMMADQTHYTDTRAMLDWGFANFKMMNIAENDATYQVKQEGRLDFLSIDSAENSLVFLNQDDFAVLPQNASFQSLQSSITYDFDEKQAGDNTLAFISYHYGDRLVGTATLELLSSDTENFAFLTESEADITEPASLQANPMLLDVTNKKVIHVSPIVAVIIGIFLLGLAVAAFVWFQNDTPKRRRLRKERFNQWMTQRRNRKLHF